MLNSFAFYTACVQPDRLRCGGTDANAPNARRVVSLVGGVLIQWGSAKRPVILAIGVAMLSRYGRDGLMIPLGIR